MKSTRTALALVLASAAMAFATAAPAQYGSAAPPQTTPDAARRNPQARQPERETTQHFRSQRARRSSRLQTAVNAKDAAAIPGNACSGPGQGEDQGRQLCHRQAAAEGRGRRQDNAAIGQAIEAVIASGAMSAREQRPCSTVNLGKIHYNAKAYDKAADGASSGLLQLEPNNVDAMSCWPKRAMRRAGPPRRRA